MNETIRTIRNRRSVRKYRSDQVKETDLQAIIESGSFAPSGMNSQSWHMTIIQNKSVLDNMTVVIKEGVKNADNAVTRHILDSSDFRVFHNAPTAIIVSGDAKVPYSSTDCAACIENMLLAAESLGYGSCWMDGSVLTVFQGEKGVKFMAEIGIPPDFTPFHTMALGYKGENPEMPARKENFYNIIK
jgi:nitroreductase